jgi:membrane protein implicated in regulation of membrane protease activity
MTDAAEILVVILSAFLALFLLLAIILTVLLIRVTRQIQSVTKTAQEAVDNVGKVMKAASAVATPAILSKFVTDQISKFVNKKNRGNK